MLKQPKRNCREKVLIGEIDLLLFKQLKKNSKLNISELRENLNISHNTLMIHVKRLEEQNLIKIERGKKNDFRTKYAKLTKKGEKMFTLIELKGGQSERC